VFNFVIPFVEQHALNPIVQRSIPAFSFLIALDFLRLRLPVWQSVETTCKALNSIETFSKDNQMFSVVYLLEQIDARVKKAIPHLRMNVAKIFSLVYVISYVGNEEERKAKKEFIDALYLKLFNNVKAEELVDFLLQESTKLGTRLLSHPLVTSYCEWENRATFKEKLKRQADLIYTVIAILIAISPFIIPYVQPYLQILSHVLPIR